MFVARRRSLICARTLLARASLVARGHMCVISLSTRAAGIAASGSTAGAVLLFVVGLQLATQLANAVGRGPRAAPAGGAAAQWCQPQCQ